MNQGSGIRDQGSGIRDQGVRDALALFGSSSPSYLILQSLDLANPYLEALPERLAGFVPQVEALKARLRAAGWTVVGDEPLKLTLNLRPVGTSIACPLALRDPSGPALAAALEQAGIYCEFFDADYLVCMLTPENTPEDLRRLEAALLDGNVLADGQMRTKMVQTEAGSSEPMAVMEYVYNDADGSFSFSGTGGSSSFGFNDMTMTNAEFPDLTGSLLDGMTLREVPTEDGVHMEFSMDMGKILAGNAYPMEGTMSYSIDLSPKTGSVQALSKEPTQLLELDQMSLGMLVMRIYNKISGGNAFNFN